MRDSGENFFIAMQKAKLQWAKEGMRDVQKMRQ